MTAVTDATLVIETLIGRTLTAQQLQNVGIRYKYSDPYGLGVFVDPENPTNEELAQLFLDTTLRHAKHLLRNSGETEEHEVSRTNVSTAGDTAVANLE
jgi:hypothetical protein